MNQDVANGMALLDKERPGWEDLIDIAQLDIASSEKCICGQLYGTFWDGIQALDHVGDSMDYGFSYRPTVSDGLRVIVSSGASLTDAWREAIVARRLAKTPVLQEAYC